MDGVKNIKKASVCCIISHKAFCYLQLLLSTINNFQRDLLFNEEYFALLNGFF